MRIRHTQAGSFRAPASRSHLPHCLFVFVRREAISSRLRATRAGTAEVEATLSYSAVRHDK